MDAEKADPAQSKRAIHDLRYGVRINLRLERVRWRFCGALSVVRAE